MVADQVKARRRDQRGQFFQQLERAMNLYQSGFRCVVALMGSNLSKRQVEILAAEFETATFILDPDEAGQKLKRQVFDLVSKMPVRIVESEKQVDVMSVEELQMIFNPKPM
jgi:DNA primase